jgi:signal transduction histidine kinase
VTYVLAVDDVEQNLVALQALLASPGITVLCATSGAQALELLLSHEVAVALLDVQMPKMDGFELAELMRGAARTRDVPIIFVTAAGPDPARRFRGYEAGAVDFLNKPIDPQILRHKVDIFVRLYEQKLRLNEQLDTLSRLLRTNETLTAVLGHDLRNPLDSILGNARLIERASKDDIVRGAAGRIASSVARMARMIDQLLDLARVRSGRLELHPERADLLEIARAAIDEARAGAPDAPPIVLAHDGDTAGRWDVDRLAQVLSNLLGNAIAHGRAGSEIRVSIDGTSPHRVRLDVRNEGTIPAELQPSIFDPFKRPARGASPSGGLGLGLHIVQQLVQLHLGAVSVESTRLTGTRFSVELPREVGAAQSPRVR